MTHITCIQVGGSIDKAYPRSELNHGYNFEIQEPAYNHIFEEVKPLFTFESIEVCRKDSLDLTSGDREKIAAAVVRAASDMVIVTHGTDTIHVTAEVLHKMSIAKTIVLTGSNLPETFKHSDAHFNLGMAVGGVQVLPHGVYIALNGLLQPWAEYRKR